MADKFNDNSSKAHGGEDDARAELAGDWARRTASMVSPNAQSGARGANGRGPKPLPISALPVPVDDPVAPADEPQHLDLPRNAKGELSPAQRARLGLDLEPTRDDPAAQSAAQAPEAPPAGQPLQPPSQQPAPRAQPQANAAAPEPAFEAMPEPSGGERNAQMQPDSAFDFRTMEAEPFDAHGGEAPALRPVEADGPRLAPVTSEPRLAPARDRTAPADRAARSKSEREAAEAEARRRRDDEDAFEHVKRDRNVLSYGIAWTVFAIVITGIVAFTNSMSGDPATAAGPGPLIPGLVSIALGWIVVIAARAMGRGWWGLMALPALVLLVGPYVYANYWATSVEDGARSYLSNNGAGVLIDMDATSVVSATVNTSRGCFAINRTRSSFDTEIDVVTYDAETARQQADYALAPLYAGRIEAGGERATSRVFTYKGGRPPAIVTTPTAPPLDCAHSTSAPGTGANTSGQG